MAGILYVVATPIGNLEDVTLRALRVLRDVSIIAAEDTRRTARLLQHYSISTRTTSLHEHNERQKAAGLIQRLVAGDSVALVSDAGTPVIADPGQTLVGAARAAGIRVEAIPGPSAVMAALSTSGFPASEFAFLGFPPSRSTDRKKWIGALARESRLAVFFEAPHRILSTLRMLGEETGFDRLICVGRELTKAHEELVIRPISDLLEHFATPKGEFTVIVPPSQQPPDRPNAEVDIASIRRELGRLTNTPGLSTRQAVKQLAEQHHLPANELYRLLSRPE
jgi:16S rRNA (cytidine1402-2'-O)-methyltransferase